MEKDKKIEQLKNNFDKDVNKSLWIIKKYFSEKFKSANIKEIEKQFLEFDLKLEEIEKEFYWKDDEKEKQEDKKQEEKKEENKNKEQSKDKKEKKKEKKSINKEELKIRNSEIKEFLQNFKKQERNIYVYLYFLYKILIELGNEIKVINKNVNELTEEEKNKISKCLNIWVQVIFDE